MTISFRASFRTPFNTFIASFRAAAAAVRHFASAGLLAAIIAPLMLVGCYLPDAFTIDLNVDQNGDYRFSYRGHLVQPKLTEGLMNGSINEDDEKKRVEIVLADLKRDSGVKQLTYQGEGIFNIVYERRSNIIRDKSYVFVRRNSRILEMFFRAESNTVEIRGGFVPDQYEESLNAIGYQMTGKIEIRTTAGVRSHNANDFLNTGGQNRLRWEIKSITDPVPNVIIG